MTFDHSWDVACAMDGDLSSAGGVDSQPIVDFLTFLRRKLGKDLANYSRQNDDLTYLIEAVSQVDFYPEDGFYECKIMPLGIGEASYDMTSDKLFTENFHELVVMSPFLSETVIEGLNDDGKTLTGTTRTLITRRSELANIKSGKASNFDVYVMKDEIIDGESSVSDGEKLKHSAIYADLGKGNPALYEDEEKQQEEESPKQDIHAKIYLKRKNTTTDLYLGSMNASYGAIHSNVEMMVRLRTRNSVLNGKKFLDDIMGEDWEGKKNPFELVSLDDVDEADNMTVQDRVEQLIKRVCRIKMYAVIEQADGRYDIIMTANISKPLDGVWIRPLRSNKESGLFPKMSFQNLEILQLSEFYVVSATIEDCTLERVIMIPTTGIPEEPCFRVKRRITVNLLVKRKKHRNHHLFQYKTKRICFRWKLDLSGFAEYNYPVGYFL